MARPARGSSSALVGAAIALVGGVTSSASAETPSDRATAFEVDRSTPVAGRSELGFDGGAPLDTWGASIGLGYLDRPHVLSQGIAVDHRETLFLGAAVSFGSSIVVEGRLPLSHQLGDRLRPLAAGDGPRLDRWVPNDLHLAARARVGRVHAHDTADDGHDLLAVFVRGDLALPTGDESDFAGDLRYRLATNLIARLDLGPVILAASGGVTFRGAEVLVEGHVMGNELDGSLGLVVPLPTSVALTAELDGALGDDVAGKRGPSPVLAGGGAVVELVPGLQLGVRAQAGLNDQIGAPRFVGMLELAWHPPATRPEVPAKPATSAPSPPSDPPALDED